MPQLELNKPLPVVSNNQILTFNQSTDIELTIKALEDGIQVLITAFYNNGLILLREIGMHLKSTMPNKSYQEQRDFRSEYHKLSSLVLIEIVNHKLIVKKAPTLGWIEKLYPDNDHFLLSFSQVQGFNSSWQWYKNGISMPVLRNKIHPYYGTYFPTRFDHLILFDNWLKRYEGLKKTAIDVGIGCGVLSFQMINHGFQKVYGTDTNPNAIFGLSECIKNTKLSRKIELDLGNLFGKWSKQTELIVFNPPWLPNSQSLNRLDDAIYYNEKLFPDFFKEAKERLLPDGKLVILFSNLAQITDETSVHPIEKELKDGHRFRLEKCLKKKVKAASLKSKRDLHWRSLEVVELWQLTHKNG